MTFHGFFQTLDNKIQDSEFPAQPKLAQLGFKKQTQSLDTAISRGPHACRTHPSNLTVSAISLVSVKSAKEVQMDSIIDDFIRRNCSMSIMPTTELRQKGYAKVQSK
jgi:hypothetical protein